MKKLLVALLIVVPAVILHAGEVQIPSDLVGKYHGTWVSVGKIYDEKEFILEIKEDGTGVYCDATDVSQANPDGCSPIESTYSPQGIIIKIKYEGNEGATITWNTKKKMAQWEAPTSKWGYQSPIEKVE